MIDPAELVQNRLIAAMGREVLHRWAPHLGPVEMQLGESVYEPGHTLEYVYFPTTALVSLLHVMSNGASAEIAVVGNDGMVGVFLFLGAGSTSTRGVVQSAGRALRLPLAQLHNEFARSGSVMSIMLRYTQALITQMTQTAACNRHHTIDQQLCRWLLLSLDRIEGNELVMTHELIANMLGVRREGVTAAAHKLQLRGLIRYSRGHITVLDRQGIERCACECYAVVKKEHDRLLPPVPRPACAA